MKEGWTEKEEGERKKEIKGRRGREKKREMEKEGKRERDKKRERENVIECAELIQDTVRECAEMYRRLSGCGHGTGEGERMQTWYRRGYRHYT